MPLFIKPLSNEAAFNKGIEYFTEMVFFYGILVAIALWEVEKSYQASSNLKLQMKTYTQSCNDSIT